ncbi:YeeE/YedE thiosulfate transporter family protein [Desulfovibrio desulfuricans]|uniref:YeeE/YedE thiosulfate transporter family protein n=1 Tax=Desulfovibrio desulfuricans TaxID=876 RepID=UPI0003B60AB7|nr:YeeE/YedE thiosulfate transporter family protein [Desulfovibrio desulfuricans]
MKKNNKNTYIIGIMLGLLAIASAVATTVLLGKSNYLGTSTSFVRAAGFIEEFFSPTSTSSVSYYVTQKIKVDWQFMLVVGIAVGAFLSSLANGTFKIEWVPPIWRERFGNSVVKRAFGAFIGGIFAMYGARLADGCPSGHGLSGVMQLSVSSLVALFLFVAVGALIAHAVYRGGAK